jgi:hypothetical protein
MNGWSAWEINKGDNVSIPDVWIERSFTYINTNPEYNEKQIYLNIGWKNYDAEATITLGIFGNPVLDNSSCIISVEIERAGSDEIHISYKNQEIVAFPQAQLGNITYGYFGTTFQS